MALEAKYEFNDAKQAIDADEDFEVLKKAVRVDLACGQQKKEDFIGVDGVAGPGVDIVHDLETFPWPFADRSVDEVFCSHYVEHTSDLVKFMDELYRVMKPLSLATIVCPYWANERGFQDPTHKRFITMKTFYYFDRQWVKSIKMDHYMGVADFEVLAVTPMVNQAWQGRADEAVRYAMKHYINVIDDLTIVLRRRQDERG